MCPLEQTPSLSPLGVTKQGAVAGRGRTILLLRTGDRPGQRLRRCRLWVFDVRPVHGEGGLGGGAKQWMVPWSVVPA